MGHGSWVTMWEVLWVGALWNRVQSFSVSVTLPVTSQAFPYRAWSLTAEIDPGQHRSSGCAPTLGAPERFLHWK